MKGIRDLAPRLNQRTVVLQDRLAAFASECVEKGFSPGETVLLACMHHALDRVEVRPYTMGRYTIHGMVNECSRKLSKELGEVGSPADLERFREKLLQLWWYGTQPLDLTSIRKLQGVVHSKNFQALLDSWNASVPAEVPEGKSLEEALRPYFTRVELDVPSDLPSESLKQVAKRCGLHSFSYNSWLYQNEEAWVTRQLEQIHSAMEIMTGWKGPVVGFNGWSSLHTDDVRCSAAGSMQMCAVSLSKKRGKNFLGRSFVRLDPSVGWGALGHEWVHSLDALMAVEQHGEVGAMTSERSEVAKDHILNMERTPPEQTPEHVKCWLKEYEGRFQEFAWHEERQTSPDAEQHLERWKALLDRVEAGEDIPNLHEAYRLVFPNPYLDRWEERLAYAYNRAEDYLGGLPAMPSYVKPVMLGTPYECLQAARGFREFLMSPEVQACWAQAQLPVQEGSLLDEVAKRRLRQKQESRQRLRGTIRP